MELAYAAITNLGHESRGAEAAPARLSATPAAHALIARLRSTHGPLMFHQAGGIGEALLPLCFVQGEFPLVEMDVLLGEVDGAPFYVSHGQYRRYAQAQVTLDAVPGRAGVFSLERPTGLCFTTSARPLRPAARRLQVREARA